MIDYEQLYYDSQYEIKQLKKKIQELENDLMLVKKSEKRKVEIKREIMKEFNNFKNKRKEYQETYKDVKEEIKDYKRQLEEKDKIIDKSIEILEEYKKFCESKLNFEKSMHSPTANHNATYWKDCIDKLNYILSILRDRK